MTTITSPSPTVKRITDAIEIGYQMASQPFKLDVTLRRFATDAVTGERSAHLVRDFTLVG